MPPCYKQTMLSPAKKTILLVEDNPVTAKLETKILQKNGFDVIHASSGEKAIKTMESSPQINLILMDIDLGPGMDGTITAQILLQQCDLPLIFLSSHTEKEIVEKTEGITSYGYIVKDSGETVLMASIKMAFRLFDARIREQQKEQQLRESEQKFRQIYDHMEIGIARVSLSFHIEAANPSYSRMLGYEQNELIGKHLKEITHPFVIEENLKKQTQLSLGKIDHFRIEKIFIHRDGSSIHGILDANLIRDHLGQPLYVLGSVVDISHRKNAEDRINHLNRLLQAIRNINRLIAKEKNRQSLIEQTCLNLTKTRGYRNAWIALTHDQSTPAEIAESDFQGLTKTKISEHSFTEFPCFKLNLEKPQIHIFNNPEFFCQHCPLAFKNPNTAIITSGIRYEGRFFGVITVCLNSPPNIDEDEKSLFGEIARDIGLALHRLDVRAKHNQLLQTLTENEYILRQSQIIANIGSYAFVYETGRWTSSEVLDRIFGIDQNYSRDIIGWTKLIFHEDLSVINNFFQAENLSSGTEFDKEYRITRYSDGQIRWIHSKARLEFSTNGQPIRLLGTIQDITERKQMESLLRARIRLVDYAKNHTVEELLIETLDEAENLTNSKIAFYHFLEKNQHTLHLQAWSTSTSRDFCKAEGKGQHYAIDQAGVWVDCIRQRRAVIHNDYQNLPNKKGLPPGHAPVIREMVIPIFRNDEIVAILGVGNKELEYNASDVKIASYFADLAWDLAEKKIQELEIHNLLIEKEILLKEVHHRIKNNLASIEGLLYMHSESVRNTHTAAALRDSQKRIASMRILYEKLLLQTNYQETSAKDYLQDLVKIISSLFPENIKIEWKLEIEDIRIRDKILFPLGIIVNELITNTMKYAFVGKTKGIVNIRFFRENGMLCLIIQDNGLGFPEGFSLHKSKGFGMLLTRMMADQIKGEINVSSNQGTCSTLIFPH